MEWTYEMLRSMVAEHFNIYEDDIGLNSDLSELGITPRDFVDFLVDNKEKIKESGYTLKDEPTLCAEVRSTRTVYVLFEIIVKF